MKKVKKISSEINMLAIIPVVCLSIILALTSAILLGRSIKNEVEKQLKLAVYAIEKETEQMSAENTKMETVDDLLKDFKEANGIDITIFGDNPKTEYEDYDTRMFSTVPNAIGTKMDAGILKDLKANGYYFSKNANVNGEKYYACYVSVLKDEEFVGAFFAGEPASRVDLMIVQNMLNVLLISLFCAAIAGVITYSRARKTGNKVNRLQDTIEPLTKNDLTYQGSRIEVVNDEIDELNNKSILFTSNLKGIIGQIKSACISLKNIASDLNIATEYTTNNSDEIARAVEEVARGAVSQAQETNDASSQMENMSTRLNSIKDNASELHETATSMGKAKDDVVSTLAELQRINETVAEVVSSTSQQVNITNDSMHKILKAVEVIKDIADQTKLLSLNASIESARAGEHGKGFAVVAEEIGKLAHQSASSSNEIEEILAELAKNYELIIQNVENTSKNMEEQSKKLFDTENVFASLETDINSTTDKIGDIHMMVDELSEGIKKLVEVVFNLSAISQENSASTQQTMASIEELNATITHVYEKAQIVDQSADTLLQEIEVFKTE